MKRAITLKINIDTEEQGVTGLSTPCPLGVESLPDFNEFKINIFKTEVGATAPVALAHELGHMIGMIFKSPAAEGDPRMNPRDVLLGRLDPARMPDEERVDKGKRTLAAEVEAWELGEAMLQRVPEMRAAALKTYTNTWFDVPRMWKRLDDICEEAGVILK